MSKQASTIATLTILLLVVGGNLLRISTDIRIRTVDFLSIFAVGVLAGLLISQIALAIRNKDKE